MRWIGIGKVVSALIHPLHKEQRRAGSLYLSERLGNDTVIWEGGVPRNQTRKKPSISKQQQCVPRSTQ